jgi:hypothetical protein
MGSECLNGLVVGSEAGDALRGAVLLVAQGAKTNLASWGDRGPRLLAPR